MLFGMSVSCRRDSEDYRLLPRKLRLLMYSCMWLFRLILERRSYKGLVGGGIVYPEETGLGVGRGACIDIAA